MNLCALALFLVATTSIATSSTTASENNIEENGIDSRILWSHDTCEAPIEPYYRNLARRPDNGGRRGRRRRRRRRENRRKQRKERIPAPQAYQLHEIKAPKIIRELYANAIPDTFFGEGNTNGFFTCSRNRDLQACIRFKQQYGPNGFQNPDGSWNNPDGSFTVPAGDACAEGFCVPTMSFPFGSFWNFDTSINVDITGSAGNVIADFDYMLSIDVDESCETCWVNFYPFTLNPLLESVPDFSFGDLSFTNDMGMNAEEALANNVTMTLMTLQDAFEFLTETFNVAQNTYNLGDFPAFASGTGLEFSDPSREGAYKVALRIGRFKDENRTPNLCNDNFKEILSVEVPFFVDENQPLQDPILP